jgi:hypothetical protein
MSLVESIANVLVGYGVAVATQSAIFPFFGLRAPLAETLAMGAIFTVVPIARSYCLRRVFEGLRARARAFRQPAGKTETMKACVSSPTNVSNCVE